MGRKKAGFHRKSRRENFQKFPKQEVGKTPEDLARTSPGNIFSNYTPLDIVKIQRLTLEKLRAEMETIDFTKGWYEYSEVKRNLNVSDNTLKLWIRNGWLAHSKIVGMRFIHKYDIALMMIMFRVGGLFDATD
jgi:hypothetical protein